MSDPSTANGALLKLIIFALTLGIMPIGIYFTTLERVWHGNTTFAAISAVVAANVVLLAYIILSILEDSRTPITTVEPSKESKKER